MATSPRTRFAPSVPRAAFLCLACIVLGACAHGAPRSPTGQRYSSLDAAALAAGGARSSSSTAGGIGGCSSPWSGVSTCSGTSVVTLQTISKQTTTKIRSASGSAQTLLLLATTIRIPGTEASRSSTSSSPPVIWVPTEFSPRRLWAGCRTTWSHQRAGCVSGSGKGRSGAGRPAGFTEQRTRELKRKGSPRSMA